jgi:hypothetical protein
VTGPGVALRNVALKTQYPRLGEATRAIAFALREAPISQALDFLQTWSEGAWNEIEQAYPEFLEQCK